jgi:hypothetical protein
MEVKSLNLKGQELPFDKHDYERAYFSSFLRSLYPMNYPNIILYPLLSRIELLRSIVKNFIAFSYKKYATKDAASYASWALSLTSTATRLPSNGRRTATTSRLKS